MTPFLCFRIKVAQQSVSKLTAEKKVETKKINPTASLVWSGFQYDIPKGFCDTILVIQNDGWFLLLLESVVFLVWMQQSAFLPEEKC